MDVRMPNSCFFELPDGRISAVNYSDPTTVKSFLDKTPFADGYVTVQGKTIHKDEHLTLGTRYSIALRLRGGKGGFGSMLRAIGAQIEKTTNREACRDLSGRRMRDVNNEKKMVEYLAKKAQEESDREKRKLEKLERLTQTPKHFFNDPEYENKLYEVVENVDKALEKGLVAEKEVANGKKRKIQPAKNREGPDLKRGLWLGVDDVSDSDSDDEDIENLNLAVSKSRGDSSDSDAGASSSKSMPGDSGRGQTHTEVKDACVSDGTNSAVNSPKDISNKEERVTEVKNHLVMAAKFKSEDIQEETSQPPTEEQTESPTSSLPSSTLKSEERRDMEKLYEEIDLSGCNTVDDLEQLGMDKLKIALMRKGVKCGGTLKERAERLYAVKDLAPKQIDPSLKVKKAKQKRN